MSRYTFDAEKISKNAKRASSASFFSRNSAWLPLSAAAAVFVAIIGVYVLFLLPPPGDGNIEQPAASVSDEERLEAMKTKIDLGLSADEKSYMYTTFSAPLTYMELNSVLGSVSSGIGTIEISALWNGGFIDAETAKNDPDTPFYMAAKIFTYEDLYFALRDRAEFLAVEFEGVVNDENFRPIQKPVESVIPPEPIEPPVETPIEETPVEETPIEETPIEETPAEETPAEETPADDTPAEDTPPEDTPPVTPTPPVETPVEETPTETPVEETPADPNMLDIPTGSAMSVDFINENMFVVLTGRRIVLYEITTADDGTRGYNTISNISVVDPKVAYIDYETGSMLIIGSDGDVRTRLFLADGEKGTLTELDTEEITSQGFTDIAYAFHKDGEIVLKAQSADNNAIFYANRMTGWIFLNFRESENSLDITGLTDDGFIFTMDVPRSGVNVYRFYSVSFGVLELAGGAAEAQGLIRSSGAKNFSNTYRLYALTPTAVKIQVIS